MDRYGNQFATRVEKNVEVGTISADVIYTPQGMFALSVGGVILSVQYASQEDAVDAADALLDRLAEGELAVMVLPVEGYGVEPSYPEDAHDDGYAYENLPTGWDAQDHKALYE